MSRYIAFLRGVNVGGHNVTMGRLCALFEELGLTRVKSYIASGNIFFDDNHSNREALTSTIEQHLHQALGYEVPTFLRTTDELESILVQAPFKGIELTNDKRFSVIFTHDSINEKLTLPLSSSKNDMDVVAVNRHEAFVVWHIINGRPPSGKFPPDAIPPINTSRFFHTLAKILVASKTE